MPIIRSIDSNTARLPAVFAVGSSMRTSMSAAVINAAPANRPNRNNHRHRRLGNVRRHRHMRTAPLGRGRTTS